MKSVIWKENIKVLVIKVFLKKIDKFTNKSD